MKGEDEISTLRRKAGIHLSDHFTYRHLLRFTLPSVGMMLFTSVYSVVDGFFVANFVGKTSFAAITLIFPLLGLLGAVGFMLGAGGSAIVGRLLGEGKNVEARQAFSLFVYATALLGVLLTLVGQFFLQPVAEFLGAQGQTLQMCLLYGRISLLSLTAFVLQFFFQFLFVTAEKPKLGLAITVAAGSTNMLLDALLVGVLDFGLAGAALATVVSECLGGLLPLVYFARPNTSLLALGRAANTFSLLGRACTNGSSEFLININYPLLIGVYNLQLLRLAGENGVASFGVLLYVSFVFSALFLGYALGSAPLISYHFGARNTKELRNIFVKSLLINATCGVILTAIALFCAKPLALLFTGYDAELTCVTTRALRLYAPVFLFFCGNIYGSSFFTALNNGGISAVISCLRTLVFGFAALLILPCVFAIDGVWLSFSVAEAATLGVTIFLIALKRKNYRYL